MRLLVVGNVAFDFISKVRFLPRRNEATSVSELKMCFGGCAGNVAVVARSLGIGSALYSAVGRDFEGSDYERKLLDMGIDIDNLQYVNDITARSFMFSDDAGNQQIYYYSGASSKLVYKEIDFSRYACVHFSAGEISIYEDLMKDAKKSKCIVSFDPGQEMFHRNVKKDIVRCLPYADYLFFNEYEARYITKKMKIENIKDLLNDGVRAIVVSMGEDGSRVYTMERTIDIPAVRVKEVKDPTGAGDSHRAGFLVGILRGYDEVVSCRIGSVVSHFIIQGIGAQENVPSWDDVVEIYESRFGRLTHKYT